MPQLDLQKKLEELPKLREKDREEYELILTRMRKLPAKKTIERELYAMGLVPSSYVTPEEYRDAIKAVQKHYQLTVTGELGVATVSILYALYDAWARQQKRKK
jgi:N-acetyl-anhydromuramyl-L-alanine amidase AmpD